MKVTKEEQGKPSCRSGQQKLYCFIWNARIVNLPLIKLHTCHFQFSHTTIKSLDQPNSEVTLMQTTLFNEMKFIVVLAK